MKLRAEKEILKGELDKAKFIIEREIGTSKTIEEMMKEDSGWKGRAQKIETLKQKLKRAKEQFGDAVSTASFTTDSKSNAEKNLERMDLNRA